MTGAESVRAATEGNLPPVMPQENLVEFLGREVRQGVDRGTDGWELSFSREVATM